jgi:hypothetical protein
MNGVVSGGWSFVWAAYAITLIALGGYAATVLQGYFASRKPGGTSR